MFNERIKLIKDDGRVFDKVSASVQRKVYIRDMRVPVEVGDTIEQLLPSGITRRLKITKVVPFIGGFYFGSL